MTKAAKIIGFLFFAYGTNAIARPVCEGAGRDANIFWAGVEHDSFDFNHRNPFGAVPNNIHEVKIRLRTCENDVDTVRIRIWDDFLDRESWIEMRSEQLSSDPVLGPIRYFYADIPVPHFPTILYYMFELRDGSDTDYYADDDVRQFGGGTGQMIETYNDSKSYQLTVYDHNFKVADWLQGATIYQIFPDRFNNGDLTNDPVTGMDWIYGFRARKHEWVDELCDPRSSLCPDEYPNQFYGGDLDGITAKLDYLASFGVSVIYMNPITQAPSNHNYDVQDYFKVDPYFGTNEAFQRLTREAAQRGIQVVVDGSFNHTSVDHPFFDYFNRWDDMGRLINGVGPGNDDGSGACESPTSPYRSWYYLPDIGSPALTENRRNLVMCPRTGSNEISEAPSSFEAWFQYYTLPKLRTRNPDVRSYFFEDNGNSVAPFWIKQGASGWRLDVAGDVDPGATIDPQNPFWEGFRKAIQRVKPDAVMIGEDWGDGSPMLLGRELDTVMNYRFRSALLDWMFDRCFGPGCYDTRFEDNDSRPSTVIGAITPIRESRLELRLKSIQEDYPRESWLSAVNMLGSHDTNRIMFLLKKISNDDNEVAIKKYKFLVAFQFMYPGAPSVYYGDEAGVFCPGKWDGTQWQDDPYNRCPYPWPELGRPQNQEIMTLHKKLGQIRRQFSGIRQGDYQSLIANDRSRVFAFSRRLNGQHLIAVFNRSPEPSTIFVPLHKFRPTDTAVTDLMTQQTYPIVNGEVLLEKVEGLGFKILLVH
jgi:glycosidase